MILLDLLILTYDYSFNKRKIMYLLSFLVLNLSFVPKTPFTIYIYAFFGFYIFIDNKPFKALYRLSIFMIFDFITLKIILYFNLFNSWMVLTITIILRIIYYLVFKNTNSKKLEYEPNVTIRIVIFTIVFIFGLILNKFYIGG